MLLPDLSDTPGYHVVPLHSVPYSLGCGASCHSWPESTDVAHTDICNAGC